MCLQFCDSLLHHLQQPAVGQQAQLRAGHVALAEQQVSVLLDIGEQLSEAVCAQLVGKLVQLLPLSLECWQTAVRQLQVRQRKQELGGTLAERLQLDSGCQQNQRGYRQFYFSETIWSDLFCIWWWM